jgi:hypothetical protein
MTDSILSWAILILLLVAIFALFRISSALEKIWEGIDGLRGDVYEIRKTAVNASELTEAALDNILPELQKLTRDIDEADYIRSHTPP